jgi:hypothetical protein
VISRLRFVAQSLALLFHEPLKRADDGRHFRTLRDLAHVKLKATLPWPLIRVTAVGLQVDRPETLRHIGGGKAVQELAQVLKWDPALRCRPEQGFTLAFPLAPYGRLTIDRLNDPPAESVDRTRVAEVSERRALHVFGQETADGVHALGVVHSRLLRN